MLRTKRILTLLIGALILTFSMCSTGVAETATNVLRAQYKNISILFNGQAASLGTQPLIVNGSTYLPLRALATLFNKNINWDEVKQEVTITDNADSEVASLKAQIAQKDLQITALQAQLAENEIIDIDDLENQLNDDYSDYNDMEWDISLSGDEDDVVVTVDIDLDDYEDDWDDMSSSVRKSFLQKICNSILDEYEGADISGKIRDVSTSAKKTLVSFTTSSSGAVSLSSSDLGDLEDQINEDYYELGDIDELDIELDGDEEDITFTVYIDYSYFEDDWDSLSNSSIITFMENIQDDIEEEFEDADVDGEIVDTSDNDEEMATYSDSNAFSRPYPKR